MLPEEFTVDEAPDSQWVTRLVILSGKHEGRTVNIDRDRFTIGRSFICNLTLDLKQASRKHAEIAFENGQYRLRDLESKWGTRYKGQRIKEVPLQFGDEFEIAGTLIKFDFQLEGKNAFPKHVKQRMVRLTLIYGEADKRSAELVNDRFVIGKDADCDLKLHSTRISPKHAEIVYEDGRYLIRDLKGECGVFVNDERIDEATLQFGDEIIIDGNVMKFDVFSFSHDRKKKIAKIAIILAILAAASVVAYYFYFVR